MSLAVTCLCEAMFVALTAIKAKNKSTGLNIKLIILGVALPTIELRIEKLSTVIQAPGKAPINTNLSVDRKHLDFLVWLC